jgi:hypothetical protein
LDIAVLNNSGIPILMGQVVYQTGFVQPQQVPSIALASAATEATATVLGLVIADIPDGDIGQVRISGNFSPIDTTAFLDNAKVYLSDTAGDISNVPGTNEVIIGQVILVDLNGCIRITCKLVDDCSSGGGGDTTISVDVGGAQTYNMTLMGKFSLSGPLPRGNIGPEIAGEDTKLRDFRARRAIPGSAGSTSIQLEVNGSLVSGAILTWTSGDPAFTLKSVPMALDILAGDRLSFRMLTKETGPAEDIYAEVNT